MSCRQQTAVSADIDRGKRGGPELRTLSWDGKRKQILVSLLKFQLIVMIMRLELWRGAVEGQFHDRILPDIFRKR